ncbi:uncharacterized protein LOC107634007 [Arachis ipaensis]|uniref:uncharacterized protein LOC107634007 n=1 Tax=Arachis ipaensis TaxID=130454 RepID=UPI0007AF6593|nr:uncharacterized protein LOC107634007 [Arachis ipaensis]XP_025640965.1 uncharacterized protein LOC112735652 [Arachis hypogaea]
MVHCLRTWRHYLLGSHFIVKTDNVATSYFQTQNELSPKQARWQDFLTEFDFEFEYKLGKTNVVADVLSRKAELAAIFMVEGDMLHTIKEGLHHEDQDELSRGESSRTLPVVIRSFDKEIEEILANRVVRLRGVPPSIQYFIKWKGLSITEASWETHEDLWQFQEHL